MCFESTLNNIHYFESLNKLITNNRELSFSFCRKYLDWVCNTFNKQQTTHKYRYRYRYLLLFITIGNICCAKSPDYIDATVMNR